MSKRNQFIEIFYTRAGTSVVSLQYNGNPKPDCFFVERQSKPDLEISLNYSLQEIGHGNNIPVNGKNKPKQIGLTEEEKAKLRIILHELKLTKHL